MTYYPMGCTMSPRAMQLAYVSDDPASAATTPAAASAESPVSKEAPSTENSPRSKRAPKDPPVLWALLMHTDAHQ